MYKVISLDSIRIFQSGLFNRSNATLAEYNCISSSKCNRIGSTRIPLNRRSNNTIKTRYFTTHKVTTSTISVSSKDPKHPVVEPVDGTKTKKHKLTIKYSFETDPRAKVMKVPIEEGKQVITLDELHTYLVEDRINLRTVSNIRWYKEKVGGFVNVPEHGISLSKIKNDMLEIQLEKSRSKALTNGPIPSFDPNFGVIYDTLNPILRVKFLAGGKLFKRSYQALISTVGLKAEASVRCQVAFMHRTPFKPLYYHDEIELGKGVDFVLTGFVHVTWVSFADTSGGIFFIGSPLGLAGGISMVKGGVLRPIEDEENTDTPSPPAEKEKKKDDTEE